MSAFDQPKVKRTAVYVKEMDVNRPKYVRRPWDFVDLDFGTDEPTRNKRFIQIFHGDGGDTRTKIFVYDDVQIFDAPFSGDVAGAGSLI